MKNKKKKFKRDIALSSHPVVLNAIATVLEQAKKKLSNGWTQKVLARDIEGVECSPLLPSAISFSVPGAIISIETNYRLLKLINLKLRETLLKRENVKISTITEWNDRESTSRSVVLNVLDYTIANCRKADNE